MTSSNYHDRIPQILEKRFIYYDDVAHSLASGLASGKNVLLHGAGGHGKSEMVEEALQGLGLWDDAYVESFGEGMTEDKLWGGINLDAMDRPEGKRIEYHPEYSFLNSETAVFEEMLDAPSPVLMSLKDTLTAKMLRKGTQKFPMRTRVIIACTNHNPAQYADSEEDADKARCALLERFQIRAEVIWPDYTPDSYVSMYRKHHLWDTVNTQAVKLAEMMAEATSSGHFVSPRTAIHALEIVHANAMDRGHSEVQTSDLADVRCLAGLESYGKELVVDLEQFTAAAEFKDILERYKEQFGQIYEVVAKHPDSAMHHLSAAKTAEHLVNKFSDERYVDSVSSSRDHFIRHVNECIQTWNTRGLSRVRAQKIDIG